MAPCALWRSPRPARSCETVLLFPAVPTGQCGSSTWPQVADALALDASLPLPRAKRLPLSSAPLAVPNRAFLVTPLLSCCRRRNAELVRAGACIGCALPGALPVRRECARRGVQRRNGLHNSEVGSGHRAGDLECRGSRGPSRVHGVVPRDERAAHRQFRQYRAIVGHRHRSCIALVLMPMVSLTRQRRLKRCNLVPTIANPTRRQAAVEHKRGKCH